MDENKYNKEEMKKGYIKLCHELGRVANRSDINKCKDIPHYSTYLKYFNSLANLHKVTGVTKNNEQIGKMLKCEVEKILIKKRIYHGRRLDYMEIQVDTDLPVLGYIKRVYNKESLNKIWEEVESKIPKKLADYLKI